MKKASANPGTIPIPTHLRPLARVEKTGKTTTTVSLHCPCGCDRFLLYVNTYTKEENAALKPYYDALGDLFSHHLSTCTVDENGTKHHRRCVNGRWEEVFLPEQPFFAGISVVKIVCADCGAEHVIFDSRIHGYDAKTSAAIDSRVLSYVPHFRQKLRQDAALEVKIENDESLDAFRENTGLDCGPDDYADAFSWLTLYAIDREGKKRKVSDFETA